MNNQNGLISLSDPPTEFRGFRDGEECFISDDKGHYRCIFHKGKNGSFDWIERLEELV